MMIDRKEMVKIFSLIPVAIGQKIPLNSYGKFWPVATRRGYMDQRNEIVWIWA